MDQALREIPRFRKAYPQFVGEELRSWLSARHIEPESPHAWGGLTIALVAAGTIRDTNRVRKMKAPRSHARRTPIWEFV